MLVKTLQQGKRLVKVVFGFTLLIAGVIMLVTPGPGILTIVGGLALLAAEFAWARWLLERLKKQGGQLRDAVLAKTKGNPAVTPSEGK